MLFPVAHEIEAYLEPPGPMLCSMEIEMEIEMEKDKLKLAGQLFSFQFTPR